MKSLVCVSTEWVFVVFHLFRLIFFLSFVPHSVDMSCFILTLMISSNQMHWRGFSAVDFFLHTTSRLTPHTTRSMHVQYISLILTLVQRPDFSFSFLRLIFLWSILNGAKQFNSILVLVIMTETLSRGHIAHAHCTSTTNCTICYKTTNSMKR